MKKCLSMLGQCRGASLVMFSLYGPNILTSIVAVRDLHGHDTLWAKGAGVLPELLYSLPLFRILGRQWCNK